MSYRGKVWTSTKYKQEHKPEIKFSQLKSGRVMVYKHWPGERAQIITTCASMSAAKAKYPDQKPSQ